MNILSRIINSKLTRLKIIFNRFQTINNFLSLSIRNYTSMGKHFCVSNATLNIIKSHSLVNENRSFKLNSLSIRPLFKTTVPKGSVIIFMLAGKGHETTQEVNGVLFPMDEREIVARWQRRGTCPKKQKVVQ